MTLSKLNSPAQASSMVERLTYNRKEAAQALGVGLPIVTRLLESGQLAHVRAGQRILIPKTALESFLAGK